MTLWSNRRADKGYSKIKQGKESERVYWMPLLSHGKLHVELLGSTSPGDKVEGMSDFVEKLNKAVCSRFPKTTDRHRIDLVGRGGCFYKSNGKVTHGVVTALRKQGLKAFNQSRTNPGTNPGPIPGLACAGPRTWSLLPGCACHLAILFFLKQGLSPARSKVCYKCCRCLRTLT